MDHVVHPTLLRDVSPEWLTSVLRNAGLLVGGAVTAVDAEIIGEDRGFTGVVARLTLQYDAAEKDAPATLVAKFPLAEPVLDSSYQRSQAKSDGVSQQKLERAEREVEFYRAAGTGLTQVPRCYFGHVDSASGRAVLLLEDLSFCVPGDALAGCSVEEARAVLAAIQDVHERWWQDESLASVTWLNEWSTSIRQRAERYRQQAEVVIDAHGDRLGQPTVRLMRDLVEAYGRMLDALVEAPVTLIHADLHLDNVMFEQACNGTAAKIIDWQSPSRGVAMLDVAGFIVESLDSDIRRTSEAELLHEYHEGLMRAGVSDYGFERMFDDYLRAMCVRCVGQIGWLARVIDNEPLGREREFIESIFEPGWVFAAVLDHDVVERLCKA